MWIVVIACTLFLALGYFSRMAHVVIQREAWKRQYEAVHGPFDELQHARIALRRAEWHAIELGIIKCSDADDVRLSVLYWAPLVFEGDKTQEQVSWFIVRHRNRIYNAEIAADREADQAA